MSGLSSGCVETEPSESGAAVAGSHPPPAGYMYVCGEPSGPGVGVGGSARYECAFEPSAMDQPPFEDHMFGDYKDRHVQVVVGDLQFRDDLPVFANDKRKDEPLLLQSVEAPPPHPPPPPPPTTKKSEKKKSDNNGIKKKKTRFD